MRKIEYRYSEADARSLVKRFLEVDSFKEIIDPSEHLTSPHLEILNHPVEFDDGVVIGIGKLKGETVCIGAQQGAFDGGSIGEIHAAKMTGLFRKAVSENIKTVIIAFDSGGVRLHEANFGFLGVSEMIRAVLDARTAGITCIAMIGGKVGAFGGAGITSRCFDYTVMNERGRTGVSGPVVIETNMGVEEFDSQDKGLVWRTFGGKHRYIIGDADFFAADSINAFRDIVSELIGRPKPLTLANLEDEYGVLKQRFDNYRECEHALDVWRESGIADPEGVPLMDTDVFLKIVSKREQE